MSKIEIIKQALPPLVYYERVLNGTFGKPTGGGWHHWNGTCPFHHDRRAGSFFVNKITGAYKCFSCGASGGDILDFHAQHHCMGIKEAVQRLWREIS